jgi:serine protease Do
VEQAFVGLATASRSEDERAFYEARARGASGSGFLVVRETPGGGRAREALVVTNQHVVDLGDRAALELADGSPLGAADIVYTDPLHDIAILRPAQKLAVEQGFAFASAPARDQQVVIATGFPGIAGRPSYQTTRGYVSNESFRLDESPGQSTYVQHTAPIDPGSSGGPLTNESGHVLGVNTLKVSNREAVGLAVPSTAILAAIRRADVVEREHASAERRREAARLACLGLVAELAVEEPRLSVLEPMISNQLTGAEGPAAARALEGDEAFESVWEVDSARAMRLATLVRVRTSVAVGGGMNVLETCNEMHPGDAAAILTTSQVRFRIRLASFETREMAMRWEQGHWKLASFQAPPAPKKHVAVPSPPPSAKRPRPSSRK